VRQHYKVATSPAVNAVPHTEKTLAVELCG